MSVQEIMNISLTAASALDCTAGVSSISGYIQAQSTRGSVESKIPSSSSQVVTVVGAWKKRHGNNTQDGLKMHSFFEWRQVQVREDRCSPALRSEISSSEHNGQSWHRRLPHSYWWGIKKYIWMTLIHFKHFGFISFLFFFKGIYIFSCKHCIIKAQKTMFQSLLSLKCIRFSPSPCWHKTLRWVIKLALLWRCSCNHPHCSETRCRSSKCSLIFQCKTMQWLCEEEDTETWWEILWPLKSNRNILRFLSYNKTRTLVYSKSDLYANASSLGRL